MIGGTQRARFQFTWHIIPAVSSEIRLSNITVGTIVAGKLQFDDVALLSFLSTTIRHIFTVEIGKYEAR